MCRKYQTAGACLITAGLGMLRSLTDDPEILSSGALLHSLVGSWVAREDYGMEDPDVLEAISYHNTGFPGMTRLDMCVCLSDSIEPLRASYPRLEQIRAMAKPMDTELVIYGRLPGLKFERTGTLGKGAGRCDFCIRKD